MEDGLDSQETSIIQESQRMSHRALSAPTRGSVSEKLLFRPFRRLVIPAVGFVEVRVRGSHCSPKKIPRELFTQIKVIDNSRKGEMQEEGTYPRGGCE